MAWNVVVVGGGFGGLSAAREIERRAGSGAVKVTLISQQNFLLYTPFLPEAAAGTLKAATPSGPVLAAPVARTGFSFTAVRQ